MLKWWGEFLVDLSRRKVKWDARERIAKGRYGVVWGDSLWGDGIWGDGIWGNGKWGDGIWSDGLRGDGLWSDSLWVNSHSNLDIMQWKL